MFRSSRSRIGLAVFGLSLAVLLCSAPGIQHYLSAHDPNFQLLLGRQVLFDKFPCIDFFTYYGPMVAFTTAAGLGLWDCMVPEVVICAIGYSTALTLVFLLGWRCADSSPRLRAVLGLAICIICLLLLARFHKWYYWLFPLLVLYFFHRFLEANGIGRVWILLTGISAGVGWLYRFELGLVCTFAISVALLAMAIKPFEPTRFLRQFSVYFVGLSVAMAPWFAALFSLGGMRAGRDYFAATFVGGAGTLWNCAIPIPSFHWTAPFSLNSSHFVACYLAILTYAVALPWAVWHVWFRRETEMPKRVFTLSVTLIGVGLLPQGLYRADVHHFLQILPLLLLTGCLLVCQMWTASSSARPRLFRIAAKGGLILCVALALAAFKGIASGGRVDLAPFSTDLPDRYVGLAKGVEALPQHSISRLVAKMKELTRDDDSVLVPLDYTPQILSWADRPMSGILPIYVYGMLDTYEWRIRNLKAVEANPPAIVVVEPGLFDPNTDPHSLGRRNPELYNFLALNYRRVVYRHGDEYVILSRQQ